MRKFVTETGNKHLISSKKTNLRFHILNKFLKTMWIIDAFITIPQSPEFNGGPA